VVETDIGREDEQFLGRLVADGDAAGRYSLAVDHDVTTEVLALVLGGHLSIEGIRIVHAQGHVIAARRIEIRDAVDAFRNLPVALLQLWAGLAAGGKHRIAMDKLPSATLGSRVKLDRLLILDGDESDFRGRPRGLRRSELLLETP